MRKLFLVIFAIVNACLLFSLDSNLLNLIAAKDYVPIAKLVKDDWSNYGRGGDSSIKPKDESLFYYAVANKNYKLIEVLAKAEAMPAYSDFGKQYSVYKIAIDDNDPTTLEVLLKNKVYFINQVSDSPGYNEIAYSLKLGNIKILEMFNKYGFIENSWTGRTEGGEGYSTNPIVMAILSTNIDTLSYYLEKGIDPNSPYIYVAMAGPNSIDKILTPIDICNSLIDGKNGFKKIDNDSVGKMKKMITKFGGKTLTEIIESNNGLDFYKKYHFDSSIGLINDDNVRFREGPNLDSKILMKLQKGEKVIVIDKAIIEQKRPRDLFWLKCYRLDGTIGWVYGDYVNYRE